jgi:GntR family transcriptional regulator
MKMREPSKIVANSSFQESAIPLYYQITNILKEKIYLGEYHYGDLLPGEEKLCEFFEVSRITIRKALSSLKHEGLIFRKKGFGSIVQETGSSLQPMKLTGSIEDIVAKGIKTKTQILNFGHIAPSRLIAERLQLEKDQKVLRIVRIRSIKGRTFFLHPQFCSGSFGKEDQTKRITQRALDEYF